MSTRSLIGILTPFILFILTLLRLTILAYFDYVLNLLAIEPGASLIIEIDSLPFLIIIDVCVWSGEFGLLYSLLRLSGC